VIEFLLTRLSLLVLLVALPLALRRWRSSDESRGRRRLAYAYGLIVFLGAIPLDVAITNTGYFSVSLRPIAWGLPTRATRDRIRAGEVVGGGCVVPLYPPHRAVLFTW
jgi:hypothetical protein